MIAHYNHGNGHRERPDLYRSGMWVRVEHIYYLPQVHACKGTKLKITYQYVSGSI